MNETGFLDQLKQWLGERADRTVYACVEDLVEHGLDRARFAETEPSPNRQDITQFLAAWGRHAGLAEEQCREWLLAYCVTKLAVISASSAARIRHSTKSNLKYIFGSNVPFVCDLEHNPFKARCTRNCPLYAEMEAGYRQRQYEAAHPNYEVKHVPPVIPPPYVPIKQRHQAQFDEAMQFIRSELEQGTKPSKILQGLKERGSKTRTGREWRYSTLHNEIRRLDREK